MQLLGAYHKRKSVQKVQPQMPKRKKSEHSRQLSRKKHRTQYAGIQSPQTEIQNYKRKNFKILNELQSTSEKKEDNEHQNKNNGLTKESIITDRTQQSKLLTDDSMDRSQSINRNKQNYSINSLRNEKSPNEVTTNNNINNHEDMSKEQITSRFTENHHDTEESLAFILNHTKSKESNPLINTARLKEEEKISKGSPLQNNIQTEKHLISEFKLGSSDNEVQYSKNGSGSISSLNQGDLTKNMQSNIRQSNEEDEQNNDQQNEANQQNEADGENFQDYEFGGKNSGSIIESMQQNVDKKKKKGKKIMPPPKVQSYTFDASFKKKPDNWRQLNRYLPQSQEQHRMALERYIKQRTSLQLRRQQQEIMKLVQQYQVNKNAVKAVTNRKIETNKIMENIYKAKRLNESNKQSMSLPHLKKIKAPKQQVIIPQVNELYSQIGAHIPSSEEQKYKIKNMIAKTLDPQKKRQSISEVKYSISYTKLGFGVKQSRNLYEDEIKQSQLQNIEKIERRLREKGIEYNPASIRKSLLNLRDIPVNYTISCPEIKKKKKRQVEFEQEQIKKNQNVKAKQVSKLDLPQKQLPSNAFYKIFPL